VVSHRETNLKLIERLNEGGSEKAKKLHKSREKLLVDERIDAIKDPGTDVLEIGLLAGYDLDYGLGCKSVTIINYN
jgi:3-methylcrotonyl-CoA carboxylase beta subunit